MCCSAMDLALKPLSFPAAQVAGMRAGPDLGCSSLRLRDEKDQRKIRPVFSSVYVTRPMSSTRWSSSPSAPHAERSLGLAHRVSRKRAQSSPPEHGHCHRRDQDQDLDRNSSEPDPLTWMLQQLLARHEAYMADAERDRNELTTRIEQLEMDKRDLEAENARTVEQNRNLLDQLEALNTSVLDSEVRIQVLEASLHSSQQTVRRLESATARAEEMERHLAILEQEQASLQNTLLLTQTDARSAVQRWRKAERGISDLQEQLERMEREAREERDRHAEILDRMERNRAMERELNTAAGRLKGAAAVKSMESGTKGGAVVSHFVRDLLQDNANLQQGLVELREMLMNSNDEIQMLREQLESHQPAADTVPGDTSATPTLRAELQPAQSPRPSVQPLSREVHIHHHYHVSNKQEVKKPKKKRQVITAGIFTPPSAPSSPPRNAPWHLSQESSVAAARSHPAKDAAQWSAYPDHASDDYPSSVPSSPRTNPRNSIFDVMTDTSMPTSPTTSVDPMSPFWRAEHRKQSSNVSSLNFPAPLSFPDVAPPRRQPHPFMPPGGVTKSLAERIEEESGPSQQSGALEILDNGAGIGADDSTVVGSVEELESENFHEAETASASEEASPSCQPGAVSDLDFPAVLTRPRLRRGQSHESIISLAGGLDIHTLKSRSSQMTIRPIGATTADIGLSAVIAHPTISRGSNDPSKRSSAVIRDSLSLAGLAVNGPMPRMRIVSSPAASVSSASSADGSQHSAGGTGSGRFGKLVAWRPWGQTGATTFAVPDPALVTTLSVGDSTSTPTVSKFKSGESALKPTGSIRERDTRRAPGINQPGSIPGFYEYWTMHQRRGPPSRVNADVIDADALRDGLEG